VSVVRIATRGSDLALWQARFVAREIEAKLACETRLVTIETSGDRLLDVSLARLGGKGLFVKEIEEALLEGRADTAVHSAKDLPAALHPELELAAFPERADPRDALVARQPDAALASLRAGARIGTGSARRIAQLRRLRPDLEIVPLRGNVPTRLRKLAEQDLDAVVLACAGLERLGLGAQIAERIDPAQLLPAAGQGTLAVQARRGDALALRLRALDHAGSAARIAAERAVCEGLGGDCNVPLAALAEDLPDGRLRLRGEVIAPDGRRDAVAELAFPAERARQGGAELARLLLERGADEILRACRAELAS
jgi:hydroxymethylbilane synthase